MTLGSLFDGSGGFPLAGLLNGIEPVWASDLPERKRESMKVHGPASSLSSYGS